MQNETYSTKKIKKWGGSLIIKLSTEEIEILNIKKNDEVILHIQKLENQEKEREVNIMQEQEIEGAHLRNGEEFDEEEEFNEEEQNE